MQMISLIHMGTNEAECDMLRRGLSRFAIEVIPSKPSYANYVKTLQYMPDAILMEMPERYSDQLHYIQMLQQHEQASKIPIIAYGSVLDSAIREGIIQIGVSVYIQRPFSFDEIVKTLSSSISSQKRRILQIGGATQQQNQVDSQQLLSSTVAPAIKLDILTEHIAGLMAFPFVVIELLRLTNNVNASATDLARTIQTDPVITTNLLKLANSVYFAGNGHSISSVKDAVVRIGFRETRRVVMSMAVMDLFDPQQKNMGFNRTSFWYYCIATALITERLASYSSDLKTDEAFLIGLLRNFGTILLDEFFPGVFSYLLQKTTDTGDSFISTEFAVMGITHHEMVNRLFSVWNMPEVIREGVTSPITNIALSTSIDPNSLASRGKEYALHAVTAESIAKAWRLGSATDQVVAPIAPWVFQYFHITNYIGDSFKTRILNDLASYRQDLKIDAEEGNQEPHCPADNHPLRLGIIDLNPTFNVFLPWVEYLRSLNFSITMLELSAKPQTIMQSADLVLINAEPKDIADSLQPLRAFLDALKKPLPETSEILHLPVLMIVDPTFTPAPFANYDFLSVMYSSFDLRFLNTIIHKLMRGNRVGVEILNQGIVITDAQQQTSANYLCLLDKIQTAQQHSALVATSPQSKMRDLLMLAAETLSKEQKFAEANAMLAMVLEGMREESDA